jgi:hypothetical protein
MYWLDYSAAELSGTIIKNAGYTGAIRYIDSPANLGRKHTSLAEYRSILAAGLGMRLVMEVSTGDANGGRANGVALAKRAKAGADYLGYGGVIYFCNDTPSLPSSTLWDDFLTGAASVLGWARVGAYGFANAMDVASHMTPCQHFWQAGRRSDVRPFVQIWQDNNTQVTVGGIACDRNLILKPLTEENEVELTDAFNETAQKPGTVGHTLLNVKQNAAAARAYVDTLEPKVAGLQSEVAAVKAIETENQRRIGLLKDEVLAAVAAGQGTGGVNVDALAAQVAAQLGPVIGQVVADEVARRLAN